MEIVICGVPRSGNVLLWNILIEILSTTGKDYYSEDHFNELDQRLSLLNFIFGSMQDYVTRGESALKDPFMMRWGIIEAFEGIIEKIAEHHKSFLKNEHLFFKVPYEELREKPSWMIPRIAERVGVSIDEKGASEIWKKVGNRALTGRWLYHFRDDRRQYFRLRDFLTREHLRILEKHNINDLITATGYDKALCYTKKDIAISDSCRINVTIPEWCRAVAMIESDEYKNEIVIGRNTMRYSGPALDKQTMYRLSEVVTGYLDGDRVSLSGKSVVLYGGGRLGRYVDERLPDTATRLGYIENDDFSLLKRESFDTVVLCSIGHESVMREKLIGQGLASE